MLLAHVLNMLLPWFQRNQMHLNKDECKYVAFGYKSPRWINDFNLKINGGEVIERVQKIKYLRLVIYEKLTWKRNSSALQEKLRKINYILYRMMGLSSMNHLV